MQTNKLNISLIKQMLYLEIKEYYNNLKEKKNIEADISSLEEMIKILESNNFELMMDNYLLFDTLIPYYFSQSEESSKTLLKLLYSAIYNCENYIKHSEKYSEIEFKKNKETIKKINNKLSKVLEIYIAKLLTKNPQKNEKIINEYKEIITNLKFNKPISHNQYEILLKLFEEKKLTDKQTIILLEKIKGHNISTHLNKGKINYNKTNEIINIQLLGFEKFEQITWLEDKRKSQLDDLAEIVFSQGVDEIILQMCPSYKENLIFSDGYEIDHIKYFYIKLLTHYQNEMLEIHNHFENLKNYLDKNLRDFIVKLYKEYQNYYLLIRDKMDKELEKYNKDFEQIKDEKDVNNLQFAAKSNGTTFFESDLKDLEKDTYKSLVDLLIKFKKNIAQTKSLKAPNNGYSEIKDDQLRIIYKHLENNKYLILGVFSKKEDNKIFEYNNICNRKPDIILDGEKMENELFDRMIENTHFGGRRNTK